MSSVDRSSSLSIAEAGNRSSSLWRFVCEPTVTKPVDTASVSAAHDSGSAVIGKLHAPLDEVGRDVDRRRHSVRRQHRQGDVGEVGGPVIEGHGDHGISDRGRVGKPSQAVGEGHDLRLPGEERHLLLEQRRRQVDLHLGSAPDAVVDEHHQSGLRSPDRVDGGRRHLDRRPSCAHHPRLRVTCAGFRRLPSWYVEFAGARRRRRSAWPDYGERRWRSKVIQSRRMCRALESRAGWSRSALGCWPPRSGPVPCCSPAARRCPHPAPS